MSASQLRKHEQFSSRILHNRRDIIVYLPPGYQEQFTSRLPVLLLQDGQNLFDGETSFIRGMDWHVGQTADELILRGKVEPLVIVGIYNTGKNRVREYTPTRAPKLGGGSADRYGKFIVEELLPFLRATYRVTGQREQTGIGGSSLGGLLALYLGLKLPKVFGKIAALSPSVWWHDRVIFRLAEKTRIDTRARTWLDIGTREGPQIADDVENFGDILLNKGWLPHVDLQFERIEGGEHNEAAWAQRIGRVLEFLFPAK